MPPSGSGISSVMAEEQRLRNHRVALERRNDMEVKEIEEQHAENLAQTLQTKTEQLEALRRDYDVKISAEAEQLESRMEAIRATNDRKMDEEKRVTDSELTNLRISNQQRIGEYKKNSEAQMDALRKQLQASTETLHAKAQKEAKKSATMAAKKEGLEA